MRFLFINPPGGWNDIFTKGKFSFESAIFPPLGLLYLSGVLEADGHTVQVIDFGAEDISKEQLEKSVMLSDAIGMSVYTPNYKTSVDISREIKKLDPDIPLIIGGPHCTFLPKRSLLDVTPADISVRGEGEQVIIDIVRCLEGRKKLSEVPGVYYRENNEIKAGKPFEIIKDLDSLQFPARHLVDKYEYGSILDARLRLFNKKFTSMITSRGCPFRCRFCANYGYLSKNYGYRERSVESVVKEIQEIDEKYNSLLILDDNFLVNKRRTHQILDNIIEMGCTMDLIIGAARVDSADRELYEKMKKAGVKSIGFGIESGNQDVLDFYNKRITLNQIRAAVQLSREMDFITFGTFIFGAPIETKKHIEKTIEFACSLPLDIAIFGPLAYLIGSDLWMEAVKDKKIRKDEYKVIADSSRGLGNFTQEELFRYTNEAFRRFYLRPQFLLNQLFRAFIKNDFGLIKLGIKLLLGYRQIPFE